jgi:hypothetical protein
MNGLSVLLFRYAKKLDNGSYPTVAICTKSGAHYVGDMHNWDAPLNPGLVVVSVHNEDQDVYIAIEAIESVAVSRKNK